MHKLRLHEGGEGQWHQPRVCHLRTPGLHSPGPRRRQRRGAQHGSRRRRGRERPFSTRNILEQGHRDIGQDYELSDVLGQGAFGVVRRATHRRTGLRYAVKSVFKRQLQRRVELEDLKREVQILSLLSSHPNVAALLQTYEDDDAVHIVLELCEGGELFERVASQGSLTERTAAHFFRMCVSVVAHMHALGIAHRDLKPENFMLSDSSPGARVKACDFGLSQFYSPGRPFHSLVGSAFYVAPEVLKRHYGPQADVWSLGVCLYCLLSGLLPYFGETEEEVFDMVLNADIDLETSPWPSVSRAAKDLVRSMLQRDPSRRPTPAEILKSPWLSEAAPDLPLDAVAGRLGRLAARAKEHRTAMVLATSTLGQVDVPGLAALLRRMDADQSGQVSAEELRVALQRQGHTVTEEVAARMVQQADTDGDGQIGLAELLAVSLGKSEESRTALLRALFSKLDVNKDGRISLEGLSTWQGVDASALWPGGGPMQFEQFAAWMDRSGFASLQEAVRRRPHCFEGGDEAASEAGSSGSALERGGSSGHALQPTKASEGHRQCGGAKPHPQPPQLPQPWAHRPAGPPTHPTDTRPTMRLTRHLALLALVLLAAAAAPAAARSLTATKREREQLAAQEAQLAQLVAQGQAQIAEQVQEQAAQAQRTEEEQKQREAQQLADQQDQLAELVADAEKEAKRAARKAEKEAESQHEEAAAAAAEAEAEAAAEEHHSRKGGKKGGKKASSAQEFTATRSGGGGGGPTAYATYHYYSPNYETSSLYCADVFQSGGYDKASLLDRPWTAYCNDQGLGPMSQDKCGQSLCVTNTATGQTVKMVVVDMCGQGGVDMDPLGFNAIDGNGAGVRDGHMDVKLEWC
ncbi:calcium-dependent kinase 34-like [Micractinium conductrix]|uniref:Calcium-dependent kinase 34-like n=1 Tax=Micractinium conductrix TaxID=554055 RepID=A0A2P6VJ03_9CHLO|nr:calcium-dependent kinase 34-like [Micractinium conductrix]|eukprot:PSC74081.1 calcium-dependent kinase 34-like [Micractinium conductrix]